MAQVFNEQEGRSGGVRIGESDTGMGDTMEVCAMGDFGSPDGIK